jgi:hypothetical protein
MNNPVHDHVNQIRFDNSRLIGNHKMIRVMFNLMPYSPLLNDSINSLQTQLKYYVGGASYEKAINL